MQVSQFIHITGATGPHARKVNGVYELTDEIHNGRALFRKKDDNDKWLRYVPNKTWMVSSTSDKDKNNSSGWLCSLEADLIDPTQATWLVWDNVKWDKQSSVTANKVCGMMPMTNNYNNWKHGGFT